MTLFDDGALDESFSVSEISDAIGAALRGALPREVWVRGEIRDLTRARSGHVYFRLVEAGAGDRPGGTVKASLSVMLSARNKRAVNDTLKAAGAGRLDPGTQVKIRGRIDLYAPRGQVQLLMTDVDPVYTLGQLAAERAAVVQRLRDDGVFDANRLVPMPLLPLAVGLVTSLGSDAERDVIETLTASGIGFHVRCFDVRVQGDQAPITVAGGIAALDGTVDVIVVARGGGGATDLAAFDSERVARAICAASVPVLTGIGHERDVSVADEVAHEFHKTPTAVAQALVARVVELHGRVEAAWSAVADRADRELGDQSNRVVHLTAAIESAARTATAGQHHRLERMSGRLERAAGHGLQAQSHRLTDVAGRLARTAPRVLRDASDRRERLGDAIARTAEARLRTAGETHRGRRAQLRRVGAARLRDADQRVAAATTKLGLLDPATTLARGWSITRRPDGTIVRSAGDVEPGDRLTTTVADGDITSTAD